ncbi:MAG: sugar phosphate isomerase/epimerase [Chloroflexi bacterium]|nr:sugar phosphate isomerase/epimerase [Chloroflexota bacterium]
MHERQRLPRFSLATSMWGEVPTTTLTQALAEVTAAGFEAIEFWPPLCPLISDDMRRNARSALEAAKVQPTTMHAPLTPTVNLAAVDELERRLSVYEVAAWLAPYADLGGEVVVVHPTGSAYNDEAANAINVEAANDAARRSLDELYPIADRLGLRIACENLMERGTPRPLCRMEQLRALIEPYPATVGICLDTGHAVVNGLNPASEARAAGERLIATHLQDTDGLDDRHWVPGAGHIDWDELVSTLRQIGYTGRWTFELSSRDSAPASVACAAKQVALVWSGQTAVTADCSSP